MNATAWRGGRGGGEGYGKNCLGVLVLGLNVRGVIRYGEVREDGVGAVSCVSGGGGWKACFLVM